MKKIVAIALALAAASSSVLADTPNLNTGHTLYMVGYTHLDTQWCWDYRQVINEFIPNTLRGNFALIDKYPHYIFNFSGANRYRMMKEYYPADFEKLKSYVAAGRWFPAGSSWEESDVNSPSSESLVRQILYGNLFFRRELGKASNDYMLPDCFGFPATLPTILAHCGVKGFSTQKLPWGSAVGIPFNVGKWEGTDGSNVLSALNSMKYEYRIENDLSHDNTWLTRIDDDGKKSGVYADYTYFGEGDRGGPVPEDSVKWLEKSISGDGPVKVVSATADQMFNDLAKTDTSKLPVYKGDLLLTQHSAGSISSQAYIKRWNRRNEALAYAAEGASVAADWLGGLQYPLERLRNAWGVFLGTQFHDIMAGTALPKACEFSWNDEAIALNQFAAVTTDGVGTVARAMDTRPSAQGGIPLLLYNPLAFEREDIVSAEIALGGASAVQVFGPDGKEVPAQINGEKDGKTEIIFAAKLPSLGFAMYTALPAKEAASSRELKVSEKSIENARYKVSFNSDGDIASIYDKAEKREMLSAPARLAFMQEKPKEYPAWNMDWTDQQKAPRAYVEGPASFRATEQGPVRAAVEITRKAEGSTFVQSVRLPSGDAGDRIEVASRIDWRGKETALKAVFPLSVSNPEATYNWGFGTITRGNNNEKKYEVPSHQWFDLSDKDGSYGVTVLEDSKYGSDKPADNTLRLTLLYTPGVRDDFQHQATQDWGRHEMVYALVGHKGDWRSGNAQLNGMRLNNPLMAFAVNPHDGSLGKSFSFVNVDNHAVGVSALKKAEEGNEIVLRLFELSGASAKGVKVSFPSAVVSVREIDGQERALGPAVIRDGSLVADFGPYQPRAFALKLAAQQSAIISSAGAISTLPYDTAVASLDGEKTSGGFDKEGRTIPAEMLPRKIDAGGVQFRLPASSGNTKNAVTCRGQKIKLPSGSFDAVHILAAASGDSKCVFIAGAKPYELTIQDWSGYIGQWDNRIWKEEPPLLTYKWTIGLDHIMPGYMKRGEIAWFCSHRHDATGKNLPYESSYLFKYSLPLASGAHSLQLPDNPAIKVLAVSVSRNYATALPAAPLYDTLANQIPYP